MTSIDPPKSEEAFEANQKRLQEIKEIVFGDLTDEGVLEILDERRDLVRANATYEKEREERARAQKAKEEEQARREELKKKLDEKIASLNASITPEKSEEELLSILKERKKIEEERARIESGDTHEEPVEKNAGGDSASEETPAEEPEKNTEAVPEKKAVVEPPQSESAPAAEKATVKVSARGNTIGSVVSSGKKKKTMARGNDTNFGGQGIVDTIDSPEGRNFLDLLEKNPADALGRLESLPDDLKRNRDFMLEVAKYDPAYAMHYADAKTLKKDEEFNVLIAGLSNPRNSGNPLAEMFSEMRTPAVIQAAVKQDYRNVRYATPGMSGFDDIIAIAKKQALEKVASLGQATDVRLLLPKVLRDDLSFMKQVDELTKKSSAKKSV